MESNQKFPVSQALTRCPSPIGVVTGNYYITDDDAGSMAMALPCGSWTCPYCQERKAKQLMARSLNGSLPKAAKDAERYEFKLLTLTCGGDDYRRSRSREEAAKEMRDGFAKLVKNIRKQCGQVEYLRVSEKHKDGYPHYHVLLHGPGIKHYGILQQIRHWWCDLYGLGFVKLNVLDGEQTIEKAIKYVMKYLFKEVGYYKGLRVFAASKGTLAKRTEKMTILDHVVRMGCFSELKAVKRGGIKTRVEDGFIKFEKDFVESGAEFSIEVGVDVDEMSDAMMDEYFRGIDPGYGVKK